MGDDIAFPSHWSDPRKSVWSREYPDAISAVDYILEVTTDWQGAPSCCDEGTCAHHLKFLPRCIEHGDMAPSARAGGGTRWNCQREGCTVTCIT